MNYKVVHFKKIYKNIYLFILQEVNKKNNGKTDCGIRIKIWMCQLS